MFCQIIKSREQIGQVVKGVDAKRVFPVHTENAGLFKKISPNVQLAKLSKEYTVG